MSTLQRLIIDERTVSVGHESGEIPIRVIRDLKSDFVWGVDLQQSVDDLFQDDRWLSVCDALQLDRIGSRFVVRCGKSPTLSDVTEGDLEVGSLLAKWTQDGWDEFDQRVAQVLAQTQENKCVLVIRPSADGMLSDAISTVSWIRKYTQSSAENTSQPVKFQLILDPVGWLTHSMVRDLDDHMIRIAELCEQSTEMMNSIAAVYLRSFVSNSDQSLVSQSLTEGEIEPVRIVEPFRPIIESVGRVIVQDERDFEFMTGV